MIKILLLLSLLLSPVAHAQEAADGSKTFEARVLDSQMVDCENGSSGCYSVHLEGVTGDFVGEEMTVSIEPGDFLGNRVQTYEPGDEVIVQSQTLGGNQAFFISDRVRRTPLIALAILFIACVVLLGKFSAIRSFFGLIVTFFILMAFMLPRFLAGDSPLLVSIIGSVAIAAITLLLSHGWNMKTIASFLGITGSLFLTTVLALAFSGWMHLSGMDEETIFLLDAYPNLHAEGLLLAGIIIGTLGVLDDVAVAQASAVLELKRANARMTARELYRSAFRIGSDHIAAGVNTLILAYAGSSLPLLLLLVGVPSGESWATMLNREMLATEIVRTLVGSIGLLAAVPLTTLIASMLATRSPGKIGSEAHIHHH